MKLSSLEQHRLAHIKAMDDYIHGFIRDAEYIDWWLKDGCPYKSNEEDYEYFAKDVRAYRDLCTLFATLVQLDT